MKFPYQKSKLSIVDYSAGSGTGKAVELRSRNPSVVAALHAAPKEPDELEFQIEMAEKCKVCGGDVFPAEIGGFNCGGCGQFEENCRCIEMAKKGEVMV